MIEESLKDIDYVKYINLYDKLASDNKLNEEYSDDGLHLNDKGYEVVTSILNEYIKK